MVQSLESLCSVSLKMKFYFHFLIFILVYLYIYIEAGRPPECSFLLIYEIEISQAITSFHHHIKT